MLQYAPIDIFIHHISFYLFPSLSSVESALSPFRNSSKFTDFSLHGQPDVRSSSIDFSILLHWYASNMYQTQRGKSFYFMWTSPLFCMGRAVLHTPVKKLNLILHDSILLCLLWYHPRFHSWGNPSFKPLWTSIYLVWMEHWLLVT